MKITKSQLKSIVKECLFELLNEGLGNASQQIQQAKMPSMQQDNLMTTESRRPAPQKTVPAALKEAIKREAGGNSVMEDIFADTAASTLPTFLQNDLKASAPVVGGGLAEQVVSRANPEDLFGDDVTSKWASLAFAESPLKK